MTLEWVREVISIVASYCAAVLLGFWIGVMCSGSWRGH
jgi:hypothetical protein